MIRVYPIAVLAISLTLLVVSAWVGATRFTRLRAQIAGHKDEYGIIQGATLTLLGLIIGFTFSMALGRYDQRKNYEEEEANAIGTEYVRAGLLPAADGARVRELLVAYADQRVLFYTTRDDAELREVATETARLQTALWAAVEGPALAQPTPLSALVAAGMNDVLNSQGYTQAAWLNRIPSAAWLLMFLIAIATTALVGISVRKNDGFARVILILPVVISVAFFMIADIDSPQHGVIRVVPQNLVAVAESLRAGAGPRGRP